MSVTDVSAVREPPVTVFDVDPSVFGEMLPPSGAEIMALEEPQAIGNLLKTSSEAEILPLLEISATVPEPDADISARECA